MSFHDTELREIALIEGLITLSETDLKIHKYAYTMTYDAARATLVADEADIPADAAFQITGTAIDVIDLLLEAGPNFYAKKQAIEQYCIDRGLNAFGCLDTPPPGTGLN